MKETFDINFKLLIRHKKCNTFKKRCYIKVVELNFAIKIFLFQFTYKQNLF
jgi:hypothetical protein